MANMQSQEYGHRAPHPPPPLPNATELAEHTFPEMITLFGSFLVACLLMAAYALSLRYRKADDNDDMDENEHLIINHFRKNIDKIRNTQTDMTMDEFFKELAND